MDQHCNRCGFLDDLKNDVVTAMAPSDLQLQMENLETEITRVEEILNRLLQKRTLLKQRSNAVLSPILQLPHEITAEIFLSSFPYNLTAQWNAQTPLVLGKVCSSWRDIAWATPRLWQTVSLKVAVDKKQRYSATEAVLLREWFARAEQLPLSINFAVLSPYDADPDGINVLMSIFAQYAEQWEYAHFELYRFFDPSQSFSSGFPLLKSITIRVAFSGEEINDIFRSAPRLRHISLQGFESPTTIAFPSVLPLHLQLINTDAHDCLKILHLNPNITHYDGQWMWASNLDELAGTPLDNVVVPQLESLKIYFAEACDLFDHLTAPALRDLSIESRNFAFPYPSLLSFITRSGFSLIRLLLSYPSIPDETNLVEFLLAMPSLITLEIVDMDIGAVALRSLIVKSADALVLPNLERFIYRGVRWFKFTDLSSVLESRQVSTTSVDDGVIKPVAQLKVVHINVTHIDAGQDAEREDEFDVLSALLQLRQMKEEGMDIQIISMGVDLV